MAVVLADVATGYVLNAAKLHDQEQLSEQLQQAEASLERQIAGLKARDKFGQDAQDCWVRLR